MKKLLCRVAATAALFTLAACHDDSSNLPLYSVSGSISGLTGSGLVLSDGFKTVAPAVGATSFRFGATLEKGYTYLLTVSTQPTNQVCSVVNGIGDITTADVTNVVVTCKQKTFQLGGTVSGLIGSGLVLANGSSSVPVTSGTTQFTFASALTQGTTYTVTVMTQPMGQTCSVMGGSGTISSANVANVVVTCSDQAYSLGGTVSGLNGPGLVLANGTDTVTVPAQAATFTLPTHVAYTSSYDVKVKTQPAGLACSVTGGSGTMPAGAVTSVAVTCTDLPFTLGGTVVNSPGITLANGSNTVAVPSASGASPFVLSQPVPYGTAYSVTINSVPTGTLCTVTNGSGTMGAANVTNVTVTCATKTYTIGGSLTGLASGDTLVLANTNGDQTTVNATLSAYTMSQPVAYGSGYAITVMTAPAGKTCTIANSSGTDVTSNVTNVNVTCSPATYTIGGSITGLGAATNLVLQNNGGDSTTISANAATFTMTSGVAANSTYVITVSTQPTAPSVANAATTINCTVTNGSGTVAGANVTNVVITCSNTVSFSTAGGPYSWTVPAGVSSITIVATGGGGGGGGSGPDNAGFYTPSPGGKGGVVTSALTVNANDSLSLFVGGGGGGGGAGTGGSFGAGGGGGGSSNVNAGTTNQIIAGGGGGGGGSNSSYSGGDGNGSAGGGYGAGQGGSNGVGGEGGTDFYFTGSNGGSGNGGAGAVGGSNGGGIAGGTAGIGSGSGTGGENGGTVRNQTGGVGGGGGGGYGGGGGSAYDDGGGGGGSTGPTGSTVGVSANVTGAGSPGAAGANGSAGAAGGDGLIKITY
jgi:hypothetical protein